MVGNFREHIDERVYAALPAIVLSFLHYGITGYTQKDGHTEQTITFNP